MAAHESWIHSSKNDEVKRSVQKEEDAVNLLSPKNTRALQMIVEMDNEKEQDESIIDRLSEMKVYTEV